MSKFDVVTIGNAMIDAFLTIDEDTVFGMINKEQHMLCFQYGQKIHVDHCSFLLGGSACNVGVGLSRLGNKTGLFAEIGDDEFSQKIMQFLAKEDIDSSHIIQTNGAASSFAMGINYKGERTLFVSHVHRKHDFDLSGIQTEWIYLTSLGVEWRHVYKNVLSFVREKGVKLAFSPGTHQLEEGDGALEEVLSVASVLCMNKEEAARILKVDVKEPILSLLKNLQKKGPHVVSITDGGNGSYSIDKEDTAYFLRRFPATVVEKTGAGDAYASGFLTAIMQGKDVSEAMRWGAVNAASVIEHVGAETGLLTSSGLESKLSENEKFQPESI